MSKTGFLIVFNFSPAFRICGRSGKRWEFGVLERYHFHFHWCSLCPNLCSVLKGVKNNILESRDKKPNFKAARREINSIPLHPGYMSCTNTKIKQCLVIVGLALWSDSAINFKFRVIYHIVVGLWNVLEQQCNETSGFDSCYVSKKERRY